MSPVALVTGGGKNIGRAISLGFADAGYDLVLAGRDEAALQATAGDAGERGADVLVVPADVTDEDAVEGLAARALERFGGVDAVIANSGVGGPTAPLWETTVEQWRETLDVNVLGVFLTFRALLPHMIERGSGSLTAIVSITGKRPLWGRTPYAASKMGVAGLVRTLALEAGAHGIRVNAVSPGWVDSPRMDWAISRQAERRGVPLEQVKAEFAAESPLERMTQPGEVADACVFLASDAASGITGADLNVNGGVVMY